MEWSGAGWLEGEGERWRGMPVARGATGWNGKGRDLADQLRSELFFFPHLTPLCTARGRRLGALGIANQSVLACWRELRLLSCPAALLARRSAQTAAWPRERRRSASPSED